MFRPHSPAPFFPAEKKFRRSSSGPPSQTHDDDEQPRTPANTAIKTTQQLGQSFQLDSCQIRIPSRCSPSPKRPRYDRAVRQLSHRPRAKHFIYRSASERSLRSPALPFTSMCIFDYLLLSLMLTESQRLPPSRPLPRYERRLDERPPTWILTRSQATLAASPVRPSSGMSPAWFDRRATS